MGNLEEALWAQENEQYWHGIAAGELAGAAYRYYDVKTVRTEDPARTAYKDGFDDGFVSGYAQQVRSESRDLPALTSFMIEDDGLYEALQHDTIREQTGLDA
jgi:hypothetical protein